MSKKLKKIISIRKKPVNLKFDEDYLFSHEYKKTIPKSRVRLSKNIDISESTLKRFKHFRVFLKQQRMNPIGFKAKLLFFFKDLIKFINSSSNKETIFIEKGLWTIDSRSNQYFHWMTDAMQRIFNAKEYSPKYPIILTSNFKDKSFINETLEILGLDAVYIDHEKHYKFKNLLMSERVSPAGNYRKEIINNIASEFINSQPIIEKNNEYNRIWVSRQNAGRRMINNFSEVKKILKKYKFKVIEFEKYTFAEQVRMSMNCQVLGGVHGAGLTNMMFMNKRSKIFEVRGNLDTSNNCFFSLASDLDMKYYYFLSETDTDNFYLTNYNIDTVKFEIFLKKHI